MWKSRKRENSRSYERGRHGGKRHNKAVPISIVTEQPAPAFTGMITANECEIYGGDWLSQLILFFICGKATPMMSESDHPFTNPHG